MFEELDQFHSIGWDFDETLIGNYNSGDMQQYIIDNPEKKHYIITFRTHNLVDQIWHDLDEYPFELSRHYFEGVFNISDDAWLDNEKALLLRRAGRNNGPPTPAEIYYKEWKGMICHENGIPVLIDDNTKDTIIGCRKYNIILIHPNELGRY